MLTRSNRPDYPKKIFLTSVPWQLTKNISFESQLKFSALETCLKARLRSVIINIFIQHHYQWNYKQNLIWNKCLKPNINVHFLQWINLETSVSCSSLLACGSGVEREGGGEREKKPFRNFLSPPLSPQTGEGQRGTNATSSSIHENSF